MKIVSILKSLLIDAYRINKFTMLSMGISKGITAPKEIISSV